MPKLLNISNPPHPRTVYWTLVAAGSGVLLLAGLTLNPSASGWISEAAQAEFASTMPAEPAAVQIAQPVAKVRTVRAE
jgi:hypothetical protein